MVINSLRNSNIHKIHCNLWNEVSSELFMYSWRWEQWHKQMLPVSGYQVGRELWQTCKLGSFCPASKENNRNNKHHMNGLLRMKFLAFSNDTLAKLLSYLILSQVLCIESLFLIPTIQSWPLVVASYAQYYCKQSKPGSEAEIWHMQLNVGIELWLIVNRWISQYKGLDFNLSISW